MRPLRARYDVHKLAVFHVQPFKKFPLHRYALLLLIIQLIEKVTIQKLVLRMENRCKLDFLGEVIDNPLYKLFGADYVSLNPLSVKT